MSHQKSFSDQLRSDIKTAYQNSGNTLGWRFLYSPEKVLNGARVAFIGLNPGGSTLEAGQSEFAMNNGSAYSNESWAGCAPGQSKLQRQVLALFRRIDAMPDNVLAGNLVPFRSPNWKSIDDGAGSLKFGKELWIRVLSRAKPSVIVTMGAEVTRAVAEIMDVKTLHRYPVGWGEITGQRGTFSGGMLVGLPHLSRFSIMNRDASASELDKLFSDT